MTSPKSLSLSQVAMFIQLVGTVSVKKTSACCTHSSDMDVKLSNMPSGRSVIVLLSISLPEKRKTQQGCRNRKGTAVSYLNQDTTVSQPNAEHKYGHTKTVDAFFPKEMA